MKLSELVKYKLELEKLSTVHAQRTVDLELGKYDYLVSNNAIKIQNFDQQISDQLTKIQQEFTTFDNLIQQLLVEINNMISVTEKEWFVKSYKLYEEGQQYDSPEYILQRKPVLDTETSQILKSRIQNYTDWRHPGMIIRPGGETFVDDMVVFDPLYIVDQYHELLEPTLQKYPEEYQRRLRPYVIHEELGQEILSKVPNQQLGICLVYNFFEFRPLEIIKQYLAEIYSKLKPGGTLIMTINDCDRDKAVVLVEQNYCCYTPGTLVREWAHTVGFTQTFAWNNNGATTWLELKKPGVLETIRGGQTLAKIMSKSLAESK